MSFYDKKIGLIDSIEVNTDYRLDLVWDSVVYQHDGKCDLINAKFKGPALKEAEVIEPNSWLMLDFYKQYYIFARSIYVAKLSWKAVTYTDKYVSLGDACIEHDVELNRVPKLNDDDYIIIDTVGHDSNAHHNSLVYISYVMNSDNVLYNFWELK